jgi:hypothetical protein
LCFIVSTLVIFIVSCFGGVSVQISKKDREMIKCVSIDPVIPQPKYPSVQGSTSIGSILVEQSVIYDIATINAKSDGELFKVYMEKNNIDISKIAFNSLKRVIREDKFFDIGQDCTTKLKLEIKGYGFGSASAFKLNDRKPMIYATASLINNNSKVIWEKTENVTTLSDADTHTYKQLIENPQLTIKSFEQITEILSRRILADFKQ